MQGRNDSVHAIVFYKSIKAKKLHYKKRLSNTHINQVFLAVFPRQINNPVHEHVLTFPYSLHMFAWKIPCVMLNHNIKRQHTIILLKSHSQTISKHTLTHTYTHTHLTHTNSGQ